MEIELIHKYLDGGLEHEELIAFEKRLSSDVDFKIEVDLQREMLSHLEISNDTASAQSAIASIHKEYEYEESVALEPEASSRRWFVVGAIFLILLLLLTLIKMFNNDGSKDAQSLQFAEAPALPDASFMTKGQQDEELLNQASVLYNKQEYDTAILKFDQAIEAGSANVGEIEFYKGLSLLGAKKYEQATSLFIALRDSNPSFAMDADWYLAMSYWYNGDRAAAIPILQQFTSGNYQKKAAVYLKHVDQE